MFRNAELAGLFALSFQCKLDTSLPMAVEEYILTLGFRPKHSFCPNFVEPSIVYKNQLFSFIWRFDGSSIVFLTTVVASEGQLTA